MKQTLTLAAVLTSTLWAGTLSVHGQHGFPDYSSPTDVLNRLTELEERVQQLEEIVWSRPAEVSEEPSATTSVHVVQSGDTLHAIARRYGVEVEDLAAANGLSPHKPIFVDQQIAIPASGSIIGSEPDGGSMPVRGDSAPSGASFAGEPGGYDEGAAVDAGWNGSYRVQPGDTLFRIARQHGVSADEVALFNGLSDVNRISAGQILKVPGAGSGQAPTAGSSNDESSYPSNDDYLGSGVADAEETYHYYEVLPGDTLSLIAETFYTSDKVLYELNAELKPGATIFAGQKIIVPTSRYFEELDKLEGGV